MKGPSGLGFIDSSGDVVVNRLILILVAEFVPRAYSNRNQIRAVRNALHPVIGRLTGGTGDVHQLAIRNDGLARGNRRDRLACRHVVRIIPTRKPIVLEFGCPLRKYFSRHVWLIRVWIYEK